MRTFQFRLYDEDNLVIHSWSDQLASTEDAIQTLEDYVRHTWTPDCVYGRLFAEGWVSVCRVDDKQTLMLEGL